MNLYFVVNFLNKTFGTFDYSLLNFYHIIAKLTNGNLTFLFKIVTFITEKAFIFILFSCFLMLFKKTRNVGMCVFFAILFGFIINNLVLKDSIKRIRPYEFNDKFYMWWKYIKAPKETGFSFPSGHSTGAAAFAFSMILSLKSKKKYLFLLFPIIIGMSRNYLMAHYPSDVLFGFILGFIVSVISLFFVKIVYYILNKYDNKLFKFVKDFNITRK